MQDSDKFFKFELSVLAFLAAYPKYMDRVSKRLISNPDLEVLFDVIPVLSNGENDSVTYSMIENAVESKWEKLRAVDFDTVVRLFDIQSNLLNQPKEVAYKEFSSSLNVLRQRSKSIEAINLLDDAREKIRNGNFKEGVTLAKTLRYAANKELKSTESWLFMAIDEANGFPTGIPQFDNSGGLLLGNLFALIGDTGAQKTMASLWMCIKILLRNPKFKCLYFEKEMPVEDLARRLIAYLLKMDANELANIAIVEDDLERRQKLDEVSHKISWELSVQEEIRSAFDRLTLVPANEINDAHDIFQLVEYHEPQIWCLDFLTMISPKEDDSYNMFLKNQLTIMKNIALETKSLGIVLNQLKHNTIETRANKIPMMSDTEWGGTLKQLAAYFYSTFWPPKYYTYKYYGSKSWFYLIALKYRNSQGEDIYLRTKPEYSTFEFLEGIEYEKAKEWLDEYRANPRR